MDNSRTKNSINNVTVALVAHVCSVLLNFIVRTVFIRELGNNYLGINGLFSNILSLLSFAELGFGTAIVYALYKPLADDDHLHVSALMNFYAKVYRLIGIIVFLGGLIIVPFLPNLIGDTSQLPKDLPPLEYIFILYVINIAAGYFFNYKRSLVVASQRGRIDSANQLLFAIVKDIAQIAVLLSFRSFVLYLFVQIASTLAANICISTKANKLFPYLMEYKKEKIEKTTLKEIKKNVLAMLCHKLGSVVVSGTDNILITQYVGLIATGIYSNYVLITSTITTLIQQIMSPVTASVGNLIATESKEKGYYLFKRLMFVNAYIAIFCSSYFLLLSNRFILTFWGEDSLLGFPVVILIGINFFIVTMRKSAQIFIDTVGLFWQVKWKSIIEAIINIVASIFLAKTLGMGVFGIILGTVISNITTNFWWEPYVVYKYYFEKPLTLYFVEYLKYGSVFVLSTAIAFASTTMLAKSFTGLVITAFLGLIIINLILLIAFKRSDHFDYFASLIKSVNSRFLKRTK